MIESIRPGTYQKSVDLTPDDDITFNRTTGLYITTAGDLEVTYFDGTEDTWTAVPSNTILPMAVIKLKEATTATGIKALY
jgi:hypothetical protein